MSEEEGDAVVLKGIGASPGVVIGPAFLLDYHKVEILKRQIEKGEIDQEKQRFESGEGGALTPVVCVDKPVDEARSFDSLVEESQSTGHHWDVVFVAALSGRAGQSPTADEAQQPMQMMVETIRLGKVANYLPFSRTGELLMIG